MDKRLILDKIRRALGSQPVIFAYAYGSFITGRVRRGRDIDIAVVAEPGHNLKEPALAAAIQRELGSSRPEVDVRLISLDSAPVFLRNVLGTGQPIFSQDESARINFAVRAMKNYYDSAYLRNFLTQNMYQKIKEGNYGRRPHHH